MATTKGNGIPIEYTKAFFEGNEREEMELYAMYLSQQVRKAAKAFNEPKFTIKDTGTSYRVVNHWSKLGVIDDDRGGDSKQWRKLSLMDMMWLKVAGEMRRFGFPLEKILHAKQRLFSAPSYTHGECPYFEYAVLRVVFMKEETYILVFADGNAYPISGASLNARNLCGVIDSYLCLNMNQLVQELYSNKFDFYPKVENTSLRLTAEELSLLGDMRSGQFESIRVRLRDGKIELIEATQTVKSQRRIIEILEDARYQDIEVKRADGQVVSIKRTIKKHPGKTATEDLRALTNPSRSSENPKSEANDSHAHR